MFRELKNQPEAVRRMHSLGTFQEALSQGGGKLIVTDSVDQHFSHLWGSS